MSVDLPDFAALKARFDSETFPNSARAELRRVVDPQAVAYCPGLYRLFPGEKPDERHLRLAFLLPCCKHTPKAATLGAQLANAKVNESRVLQMARAKSPMDLIQLRRLLAHVEPAVDWQEFGEALWFWGEHAKRKIVEGYYLAKFTPAKGDTQ